MFNDELVIPTSEFGLLGLSAGGFGVSAFIAGGFGVSSFIAGDFGVSSFIAGGVIPVVIGGCGKSWVVGSMFVEFSGRLVGFDIRFVSEFICVASGSIEEVILTNCWVKRLY